MSLTANRILLRRATLVDPNQVRNGDLAEFEVCVAAAMHQAEGYCLAAVVNLDDLVGGRRVFTLDEISVLRGARAGNSS